MKFARILNNTVMETIDFNPEGCFHPDLIWVECPEDCEQRWDYIDGQFIAPPPPPVMEAVVPEVVSETVISTAPEQPVT